MIFINTDMLVGLWDRSVVGLVHFLSVEVAEEELPPLLLKSLLDWDSRTDKLVVALMLLDYKILEAI
jgi:hypothetical protein